MTARISLAHAFALLPVAIGVSKAEFLPALVGVGCSLILLLGAELLTMGEP